MYLCVVANQDVASSSSLARSCCGRTRAISVWDAARFKPYGLSFREKNVFFPLTFGRAALCCRLAFSPFSKVKRSKIFFHIKKY